MKVGIYSLRNILFQGNAESLNCKTAIGEITVLDQHRPLISVLKPCVVKIIDKENKEKYIPISSGFIEVRPNSEVRLIVEGETNI